jgi:GMP synthase PP-ATPase subunit
VAEFWEQSKKKVKDKKKENKVLPAIRGALDSKVLSHVSRSIGWLRG